MAASMMSSCDSVSEEDRFIPVTLTPQRTVLIEEFTGQQCTNCPDGHAAIREILSTLGDSVIPVSIHASDLALPASRGGFKTEAGEEYYKQVGSPALPTAVINKQTSPLQVSDWGAQINSIIMTPTPFSVKADASLSGDGKTYNINVTFSSGDDYDGKLMVWILENDLIGRQLDHGTWIPDYVHNHVFRAVVTDLWGDEVALRANEQQLKTYAYDIPDDWNPDNIYIVAFLYNEAGVAQATSTMKHE